MIFDPARVALAAALIALSPGVGAEEAAAEATAADGAGAEERGAGSAREEGDLDALTPDGLLSRDLDAEGHIVLRRLGPGGTILERTVDASGRVLAERVAGTCADLPLIEEVEKEGADPVRTVRDPSGAMLRFAIRDGRVAGDAEMVAPPAGL